ncbi:MULTISPECIES: hypothetical protein [unclassified Sporosarcina]|uniref:hypothetical protein n=1 Tax=unclassified Sporosarcina TaxID=2647733 RepID=UPI001A91EC0D|nr:MULTISPECIES: hypothetical protein [unclassified Sporosarcina]MBO0587604.1 hypothetical protein [Sporosarcina sp. E16_8]MBO0602407.1 hypothetical protein [Sporosarcina sp. E16_3]
MQDFVQASLEPYWPEFLLLVQSKQGEGRKNEGVIALVQQLAIFDAVPKKGVFAVGDTVFVVVNVEGKDVEDYYYLKSYEGSNGRVVKVLPGLQYEVLFAKSNRIGIFRYDE